MQGVNNGLPSVTMDLFYCASGLVKAESPLCTFQKICQKTSDKTQQKSLLSYLIAGF
jgi:hypothetical protein